MITTYNELLEMLVEKYANDTMFEYIDADTNVCTVSFGSFYKRVKTITDTLGELHNEKIAICMKNSYQWFVYYYAIVSSGNIGVLIPFEAGADSQINSLFLTDTKYIVTDIEERFGDFKVIKPLMDIVESEGKIVSGEQSINDLRAIVFTSGTSGNSKAVCLSNKNCLGSVNNNMADQHKEVRRERRMSALPYAHIGGITMATCFAAGGSLCVVDDMKYFFKYLTIYEPDALTVVPTHMSMIIKKLKQLNSKEFLGSNIKSITCSCAVLPEADLKIVTDNGITIMDAYGMSETTGMGAYKCYLANTNMQIGGIFSGVTIEIIDDEVVLGGDGIMLGYYNNQEETSQILKDGKIYSGDIGHFTENGVLVIDGRKKNLIILSNGENISPEGIEKKFNVNNLVEECLVYGKNDKICMDIVACKDATNDEVKALVDDYNKSVPFNQRILEVNFVDELVKNTTGKLVRH